MQKSVRGHASKGGRVTALGSAAASKGWKPTMRLTPVLPCFGTGPYFPHVPLPARPMSMWQAELRVCSPHGSCIHLHNQDPV